MCGERKSFPTPALAAQAANFVGWRYASRNRPVISHKEMVILTHVPEGRTYMKKQSVLDPDIVSGKRPSRHHHRYYDGDEYVIEETPYVVPNGKWVMEKSLMTGRWSWLVGIDHSEFEQITLHSLYGYPEMLYISDKPFGYVYAYEEDVDQSVYPAEVKSSGYKTLVYARQIHKGELGQSVPIPRLQYVRQASHKPGYAMSARDKRRGNLGWVRFEWLVEALCLPQRQAREIILGYAQFSGHHHYIDDRIVGRLIDVVLAMFEDEIKHKTPEVLSVAPETFRRFTDENPDTLWIRHGFAKTILRLQALGYQPATMEATA